MPAPNFRRLFPALAAALAGVLAFAATATARPAHRHGPAKCAHGKAAKGHSSSCRKTPPYRIVRRHFQVFVPHSGPQEGLSEVMTVGCRRREEVLAGGVEVAAANLSVAVSAPNRAANGWTAQLVNLSPTSDATASLSIFAVCSTD